MRWLPLALCVAVFGCDRSVELLPAAGDGGSAGADLATVGDLGGRDGSGDLSQTAAACVGLGQPFRIMSAGAWSCASALAAPAHRFALCSCSALTLGHDLASDAFDSTGLTVGTATTAAIGTNGDLTVTGALNLSGAIYSAGSGVAGIGGQLQVNESLHLGGGLAASAQVAVGTNAWINGDLSGVVSIVGALHVPTTASVGVQVTSASLVREAVTVAPPCPCAPAGYPDLAGLIAAALSHNDNATIGLSPGSYAPTVATTLELPCGTYAVDRLAPTGNVTLAVHGRAALIVANDVDLQGSLLVALDKDAELDLIVGGAFSLGAGRTFGSRSAPARVRLWVAGAGAVLFAGNPLVGAVVDAPRSAVSAPLGVDLAGSLLAQSFNSGGASLLHYDRAILGAGAVCGAAVESSVN